MLLPTDFLIRQDGQEFRAPDPATLLRWAREGRIRQNSQVFHPGLNRWMSARDVPELATAHRPAAHIADLARNYRQLVLWFGLQLIVVPASRAFPDLALLFGPLLLVTIGALVYYAYHTARALPSPSPIAWAAAMLIPCVNALTLLALSSRATAVCRANGIPVGLLGPRV